MAEITPDGENVPPAPRETPTLDADAIGTGAGGPYTVNVGLGILSKTMGSSTLSGISFISMSQMLALLSWALVQATRIRKIWN